jgi:hypothetical protein
VVSTEARVRIKRSQMCQASAVPTPIGCRRVSSVPIRMLCRINVFMSVCVQCPSVTLFIICCACLVHVTLDVSVPGVA